MNDMVFIAFSPTYQDECPDPSASREGSPKVYRNNRKADSRQTARSAVPHDSSTVTVESNGADGDKKVVRKSLRKK